MILQSSSTGPIAIIVALISGAALIIGALIQSSGDGGGSSYNGGGSNNSGNGGAGNSHKVAPSSPGPSPSEDVEFTVEVPPNPNPANIGIWIDGKGEGVIYTHQEPHKLSISSSEGDHSYNLKADQYYPNGAYYQTVTGSGTITVEDGREFQIYYNSGGIFLQQMS
jgi:hypothetical protein